MNKDQAIEKCTIEGNVVKLPDVQLDRKVYQEVNRVLQGIGGKWNRKHQGFFFDSDPAVLLGRVQEGESINIKKEFQFFRTPDDVADEMVYYLNLDLPGKYLHGAYYHTILEPSAGDGSLIKAIHRFHDSPTCVWAFELMDNNREKLKDIEGVQLSVTKDFLEHSEGDNHKYERIIANPPFTKNQDIDHIYKMYKLLKNSGRLVTLCSLHPWNSGNRKELAFLTWLEVIGADIHNIEPGRFKESGTEIGMKMLVIDKE